MRDEMTRRLMETPSRLPAGRLGRLTRTAVMAARNASLLGRGRGDATPVDPETLARLVASMGQLKGVAMKMGQVLSYIDVALPDEVRAALSALQTHSPPMPFDEVERVVGEALGSRADALLDGMDRTPIAAASIGQVHRSRLADGTPVAVKVQYPGIERAIRNDFGAANAGSRIPALLFPGANIRGLIREAQERIEEECDYLHEAEMQTRFAALFASDPTIHVPAVHADLCARRVLTSSFVEGLRFDDYLASGPPQADRDRVGVSLFEFYVGSLFRHGLYNCDPHPGNYLLTDDGGLAILDYGCCRRFSPEFVETLAALTRAVHADRRDELHRVFLRLGMVREGADYDFGTARDLVRSFYGPMLDDAVQAIDFGAGMEMREVMERKLQLLRLALPPEFLFLFRIRFGLLSVLAQLGTRANWYRLERACIGGEVGR